MSDAEYLIYAANRRLTAKQPDSGNVNAEPRLEPGPAIEPRLVKTPHLAKTPHPAKMPIEDAWMQEVVDKIWRARKDSNLRPPGS